MSDPGAPAFEMTGVVVRYGDTLAVDDVSVDAPAGTLSALLGPNGAGKSSLLKALSTAETPQRGRIRIFGHDVSTEPTLARRRVGLVFQERTLDKELSVVRNLWFHARLFGMSRADAAEQIDRLLTVFGLTAERDRPVERLSGGMARRVELVRALLHRPGLLILDEPTTGLDPRSRRLVWDDLLRLRDVFGVTTLYSTHYMDEAEHADAIVIMSEGRVGRRGSPAELKEDLDAGRVCLTTHDDAAATTGLRAAGFEVGTDSGGLVVRCPDPDSRIADIVASAGVAVRTLAVRRPSMDDVYIAATAGSRS